MSVLAKIQRNFQLTIPTQIRKRLKLKVGELVDFEVVEDGILVKPQEAIDKSQAWFWSKRWQVEEKKVERDFKKGKAIESKNVEEFIKELDKSKKKQIKK